MEYGSEVWRRFDAPLRAGEIEPEAAGVVSGEGDDRALNVWVRFQLEVADGVIRRARFRAFGCPHTVAAADWLAEWLEGRPVRALAELDVRRAAAALEVPAEKLGKLLRMEDALDACRRALEARDGDRLESQDGDRRWPCH
ncbi:MAG TPA: iron-sulfur cluster assembly scaffold protein [Gammaproteobacteria bacterium]